MSKRVNNKKGNLAKRGNGTDSHPTKCRARTAVTPNPPGYKGMLNLFNMNLFGLGALKSSK